MRTEAAPLPMPVDTPVTTTFFIEVSSVANVNVSPRVDIVNVSPQGFGV
jgi:hypothetical protein